MKIGISLLTVELDRLGGLNLRLGALIRALAELGHEVITIQTEESWSNSVAFFRSVRDLPITSIALDFRLGTDLLRWPRLPLLWLRPRLRQLPPDLDMLDLRDPLFSIPGHRPYPIVFGHNHFAPWIRLHLRNCGLRSSPELLELPFLHRMLSGYGKRIDAYIAQTENQRQWLIDKYGLPEHAVAAIPPGFNERLIQQALGSALPDTSDSPAIAFSGRIHRWKGVFELVEAFSWLAPRHSEWSLQFVGDGPARAELEKEVAARGLASRVLFWGRQSYAEALRTVARAQVFVLPSYIETFGMSLVEAMALGVPAISTTSCGANDYAIEEGVTGLAIPPKDPQALHHALARLISSSELRKALGVNGQERVRDLTLTKMVTSTAEFYTRLSGVDNRQA